ncbi:DUF2062 domain-containing protein [Nitratireductor aestuarii]|uniref:DUF2062 domain-containing protein n=1 Tax=Nitratireductor aestuarii TaxID=1735103 RepID=UPI00166BF2E9|nr:DUF2062 domain-containing protein [Nitratireductor aestuarii]
MLFRRRAKVTIGECVRLMLWPRRSFRRSARYFAKRALRLQASPHAIAAGVAVGVFCTFTPFVGLHFLLAIVIAWMIRANIVAAVTGTALGNPITIPFIWGATLQLGNLILNQDLLDDIAKDDLGHHLLELEFASLWDPILKPMLIGSVLLGAAAAVIAYFLVLMAARTFREKRRMRLAERAQRRALNQSVQINATVVS